MTSSQPTADKIDPKTTMKTHVSEMSPSERLAAHDARAREANAGLPTVEESPPEPKRLTFENLCGVVLDVVRDFTAKGYHPTTIHPEHVVEKARQRFPDGVKLIGEETSAGGEPAEDPLRLDSVPGAEDDGEIDAGDGLTEGGNPVGSEAAAEEVNKANEKAAPAPKAKAKGPTGPAAKKSPTRKPAGPSPKS